MRRAVLAIAAAAAATAVAGAAVAQPVPDLGARLERFDYPWPVRQQRFAVGGEAAEMAFMDVTPARPNGRSVVLLHGKNFCAATWEATARTLLAVGYRVLMPDQIGFCKSSKPRAAQYSFAALADMTRRVMAARGIARAAIVGHSMGGMLAMRFAIMFPQATERLVLVNPLGLDDPTERGLPFTDVDTLFATERMTSADSIRDYQRRAYYHGTWRPDYDRWVTMLAGMYAGAGRDTVAWAQAKTSAMIVTQPVAHELARITPPTTLLIGALDTTAFGRQQMPQGERERLRTIPQVAPAAARAMPNARLVRLDGLGHSPQVEDPARFEAALLDALRR